MLGLSKSDIAKLAAQWIADNPAEAVRMVLTAAPVAKYLTSALTDDQLEWLSYDIQTRPLGLVEFALSRGGKHFVERGLIEYRAEVEARQRKPRAMEISQSVL